MSRHSWQVALSFGLGLLITAATWAGETVTELNAVSVSATTGEKPHSKVWSYAGQWWTVLPSTAVSPSGVWLWRLEPDHTWVNVLHLSNSTAARADAKVVDNVTHVLLHEGSPELVSVEYSAGTNSPNGMFKATK